MKTFLLILIGFTYSQLHSQAVSIFGKIKNPKEEKVYVGFYANELSYDMTYIDSAVIDNHGNFSMHFEWRKSGPAQFFHGDEMTQMYLLPGDSFSLSLDTDSFDETLKYQYASQGINNYFAKKYVLFENVIQEQFMNYSLPESVFLAKSDSILKVMQGFLKEYMSQFSEEEKNQLNSFYLYEESELIYSAANDKESYPFMRIYLRKPKNEEKKDPVIKLEELSSQYYSFKTNELLFNENAFESDAYRRFILNHISAQCRNKLKDDSTLSYSVLMEDYIDSYYNGKTKEYLYAKTILQLIEHKNELERVDIMLKKFENFCTQENYIEYVKAQFELSKSLNIGNIAPDFEFTDLEGKVWKLSDLKGKVVYIDFWASWCKPCLEQVPHAKTLKEELEGKDVVFLYISIDTDTSSWKKMIELKQINGLHGIVYGGFTSVPMKLYQINGIPQYFIIGKDGKIRDNNAKRPSADVKTDLLKILDEE